MKHISTKLLVALFITTLFLPLAAFAQTGANQPSTFVAPTNKADGTVAPGSGFSLVPCSGAVSGKDPVTGQAVTGCDFAQFMTLVQRFINILLYSTTFIAVIMIVYAGFLYLTAGGDSSQTKRAKSIFKAIAIGMIISLTSWLVVYTVVTNVIDSQFGGGASNIILLNKQ